MAEDDHLRSGRAVAKALRHAARQTESLPACDTGDHRLAAITLSHLQLLCAAKHDESIYRLHSLP